MEYIYFFKHNGTKGVKIGRTSGDSVIHRFNQFKTFAPNGAEILGFFECEDCVKSEKELHKKYHETRMHGEWFDISDELVNSIVEKHKSPYIHLKKIFYEWVANPENNVEKLLKLMKVSSEIIVSKKTNESELVERYLMPGETFMTTSEIKDYIENKEKINLNINKLGAALRNSDVLRRVKKRVYGYYVGLK